MGAGRAGYTRACLPSTLLQPGGAQAAGRTRTRSKPSTSQKLLKFRRGSLGRLWKRDMHCSSMARGVEGGGDMGHLGCERRGRGGAANASYTRLWVDMGGKVDEET